MSNEKMSSTTKASDTLSQNIYNMIHFSVILFAAAFALKSGVSFSIEPITAILAVLISICLALVFNDVLTSPESTKIDVAFMLVYIAMLGYFIAYSLYNLSNILSVI